MQKKLFLLDAMALIFRAYYAMFKSPRITSKGLNTSAILGFTNTLYDVLKSEKPTHIAVSFDTGAPTVRHADYEEYKANSEATPDDIVKSIPYIKKIIEAFNIPVVAMDGYEADDVIGTTAKRAEIEGFKVYMMTSDKDYGQLVSDNIFMYKPGKFGQKAETVGVTEICEKYSIENPEQLIDILGLWGDASDNIPGVPNIGEVKAKKLVAQFGSIENMYQHIDQVENEKMRQTLVEHKDKAVMSKMLATIILDVPVELDFNKMAYHGPDASKLKAVFQELEFQSLSKRIFTDLSLEDKPHHVQNNAPDLFSSLSEDDMSADDAPQNRFNNFNQTEHFFIELKTFEDFEKETALFQAPQIYFDWIIQQDQLYGFAFSTTHHKEVFYHCFEEDKKMSAPFIAHLFNKPDNIVTYQCKQTYKLLKEMEIAVETPISDLQIAHYLIQPESSHFLEQFSENYLNYTLLPPQKNQTVSSLVQATCEKIEIYRQLYPVFKEALEKDHLTSLFEKIEMPLAEVLAEMEYTGVTLNTEVLKENSKTLDDDLERLEKEIYQLAGTTFNLASPKQLGEILFEKLRIIDNAKLTKTKQYQTGEEILVKLAGKHPMIPLILEWRTLSKLKSTYIAALPQLINPETHRIHTTFNQTVTSTGRLSSMNPNLQNIPIRTERGRDIRKAFVASDDRCCILSADYSQIELRIVASVCGDENMIDAFQHNADIHTIMAAKIYKVTPSEVTPAMRRNAKTVNFGILYGMSAFGLADRLQIPQKEARELIDAYFHNFSKINDFLENTLQFARESGYVETLLGRRRYIKEINASNAILRKAAERNAINAPIQGTAADLIKIAMIHIHNAFRKEKLKSKMILQVHDELVFEVYRDELEKVKSMVETLMTEAMTLKVPLSVEINHGKNWYEAH